MLEQETTKLGEGTWSIGKKKLHLLFSDKFAVILLRKEITSRKYV